MGLQILRVLFGKESPNLGSKKEIRKSPCLSFTEVRRLTVPGTAWREILLSVGQSGPLIFVRHDISCALQEKKKKKIGPEKAATLLSALLF